MAGGSTLLIGGARSGKSDLGQRLVASVGGDDVTVIVTAEAGDGEMSERIARHRAERPVSWDTVEAPRDLVAAVTAAPTDRALLVDCVSFWVANLIMDADSTNAAAAETEAALLDATDRLGEAIRRRQGPTVMVTNEVGFGLVPATELGRSFRDAQGRVNRRLADGCSRSLLVVAGQVVPLTPPEAIFGPLH